MLIYASLMHELTATIFHSPFFVEFAGPLILLTLLSSHHVQKRQSLLGRHGKEMTSGVL